MLNFIWFCLLSLVGYLFAILAVKNDEGANFATLQIISHSCMVLSLYFVWDLIKEPTINYLTQNLPQKNTDIQTFTIYAIIGLLAILWIAHPIFIATVLYFKKLK